MRDVVELPHGYTLAAAEQLARAAACTVHTGSTETVADKIDHAWSIIVATLFESETPPSTGQLVWAAREFYVNEAKASIECLAQLIERRVETGQDAEAEVRACPTVTPPAAHDSEGV